RHRESTCATWFCKHVRGAVGLRFWQAVHMLLISAEDALARHALLELDLEPSQLALLFPRRTQAVEKGGLEQHARDGGVGHEGYRDVWGRWIDKEVEFFERTAAAVDGLRWADVLRLAGPEVALLARVVKHAFDALLDEEPPKRLRATALHLVPIGGDTRRVWT